MFFIFFISGEWYDAAATMQGRKGSRFVKENSFVLQPPVVASVGSKIDAVLRFSGAGMVAGAFTEVSRTPLGGKEKVVYSVGSVEEKRTDERIEISVRDKSFWPLVQLEITAAGTFVGALCSCLAKVNCYHIKALTLWLHLHPVPDGGKTVGALARAFISKRVSRGGLEGCHVRNMPSYVAASLCPTRNGSIFCSAILALWTSINACLFKTHGTLRLAHGGLCLRLIVCCSEKDDYVWIELATVDWNLNLRHNEF